MSSIVFFGKAHAGKSTLVGSLVAHSGDLNLDELQYKFANEIPNYDSSDLFSAIVDDTRDERLRKVIGTRGKRTAPGSTKTSHYRNIALTDNARVTVIDTPGAEHLTKERNRGMFAGDVGVFCLEVGDVIKEEFFGKDRQYRTIMTSLALWSGLSRGRVVVALTKMDMCGFRESAFDDARETIRSLCEELELAAEFVPTCVEVRERESHNVFSPSDKKMPWYDGPTLVEALQRHLAEVAASYEEVGGLLLSVDREFANSGSHAGKTWQVKLLNGILKQGERIRLAPVVDSNREFISVSGEVEQIRANLHRDEQLQVVEEASAGDIVGLDLRSIASDAGRRISKSEFNVLYTTCGFADSAQYSVSHRFRCSVDKSFTYLFTPGRQFGLVWFGRTVEFQVQSAEQSQEGLLVLCQLLARPIAMPSRGSQGLMRSTVIIRTGLQEEEEFIQGRLLDIG